MAQELDDPEGKLLSMIMEANDSVRFAAICDEEGKIIWNGKRNGINNILSLQETKDSLRRAISTWKIRNELSHKIGKGRYTITAYDKIKRITIPLHNGHLLYISIEGDKPERILDVMKIIEYVKEKFW